MLTGAKEVKKPVSKELRLFDYEKRAFNSINAPINKEQVSIRSTKHVI